MDAVDEEDIVIEAAAVLEGQHGDRGAFVGGSGRRTLRGNWSSRRRRRDRDLSIPLTIEPERGPTEREQHRQDRKLGPAHPLLAAIPVIPRDHQHNWQADGQADGRELLHQVGPVERVRQVPDHLQQHPCARRIGQAPLHDLAASQPGPDPLFPTLGRRVGHCRAPLGAECSGIPDFRSSSQPNTKGSQRFGPDRRRRMRRASFRALAKACSGAESQAGGSVVFPASVSAFSLAGETTEPPAIALPALDAKCPPNPRTRTASTGRRPARASSANRPR